MVKIPQPTNELTASQQQHTTTQKNINHHHHGPPKPPASRGSNFTGKCNHRTPSDQSQSLQHSDVLFIDETNFSFINSTAILCETAQRAH